MHVRNPDTDTVFCPCDLVVDDLEDIFFAKIGVGSQDKNMSATNTQMQKYNHVYIIHKQTLAGEHFF